MDIRKSVSLLFFLLILITGACSVLGGSEPSQIEGRWEWIRTTGGIMGETITPDSAGIPTQRYHFKPDSKYAFFRADTLHNAGNYNLYMDEGELRISLDQVDHDGYAEDDFVSFRGADTLVLRNECTDCYISYYVKIE